MLRTRMALTALTLASSVLSFVGYAALLKYLGASVDVDTLFFASSVPMSVAGVMAGALLYILPPRFAQIEAIDQDRALKTLAGIVVAMTAAALFAAIWLVLKSSFSLFWVLWFGFALTAGLSLLSTLLICLAQTRGAYMMTAISPMLTSSALVAGVVAAVVFRQAWMVLAGQLVGAVFVVVWSMRSLGVSPRMLRRDLVLGLSALAPLKQHALSIAIGTSAFTLFPSIDAALCTQLEGGAMTTMAFGHRVWIAVATAVSLGAYTIAARTSHDVYQREGRSALCRRASRESFRMVVFGLGAWLAFVVVGHQLLAALLVSSEMSGQDLELLLDCVQWMLLGVGPAATVPYLFRVFYALQEYKKPAAIGILIPVAYGTLAWLLIRPFGTLALPYALTAVWWVSLAIALLLLNRGNDGDRVTAPSLSSGA